MVAPSKIYQVEDIKQKLESAKSAALVDYQGLTAEQAASLRQEIKAQGGQMEVLKNTLISRALETLGIKLPETLTGPTAVIFANDDEIAPLKESEKTQKEAGKPEFKYGIFEQKLLSVEELKKLLSLPSKSHLLAQFVAGLKNPLQRLAYSLSFHQTKFVLTLKALSEKKGQA